MSVERTIVESYTWVVPFTLGRLKDADTMVGVMQVPTRATVPILNLTIDSTYGVPVVVRLEGVNAPEISTIEGKMAKSWVESWFADKPELYFATNGKLDSFGRWLGDIRQSPSYLTGLANDLLTSEHAVAYTRHGAW